MGMRMKKVTYKQRELAVGYEETVTIRDRGTKWEVIIDPQGVIVLKNDQVYART